MATVTYSPQERAGVVGLALTQGVTIASKSSGVDRHTISRWLADARDNPDTPGALIVADTREAVAQRIWTVFVAGIDALADRVADPKTRAGDLARIVDVLGERYALLMGGATANIAVNGHAGITDGYTEEERHLMRDALEEAIASRRIEDDSTFITDTITRLADDPLGIPAEAIARLIQTIELRVSGRDPRYYPEPPTYLEAPDAPAE